MSKVKGNVHRPARPRPRRDVRRDGRRRPSPARPRPRRWRSSRRPTPRPPRWARASPPSAPTRCASRWRPTRRATSASRSRPKRIEGNRHFLQQDLERDAPRARPARRDCAVAARRRARRSASTTAGSSRASPPRLRGRARGHRRVPHRRGGARGLPLLLGRALRLVPRDRQAHPAPQPDGTSAQPEVVAETRATLAYVLEGEPAAHAPPHAVHHRGALAARPAAGGAPGESIAFGPYPTAATSGRARRGRRARDGHCSRRSSPRRAPCAASTSVDTKAEVPARACAPPGPEVLAVPARAGRGAIRCLVKTAGRAGLRGGAGGAREPGTTVERRDRRADGSIEVLVGLQGPGHEGRGAGAHRPRDQEASTRTSPRSKRSSASPGFVDRARQGGRRGDEGAARSPRRGQAPPRRGARARGRTLTRSGSKRARVSTHLRCRVLGKKPCKLELDGRSAAARRLPGGKSRLGGSRD